MPHTAKLGNTIVRPEAALGAAGAHNIFTIANGPILLTSLVGVILTTLMDGTASTLRLAHSVGPTNITGVLAAIADDPVGTIYIMTGVFVDALLKCEPGAGVGSGAVAAGLMSNGITMIPGTITYTNGGDQTGTVQWRLCYIPLVAGATVVAA